ncbi:MAG: N-acetylmuramoyl-L-alanine amidase [Paracoccaceae bacterium]
MRYEPNSNWHPSPNYGPRRDGLTPTLIVLHYTAMQNAEVAIKRLCDPAFEVSAHYLISRQGQVTQLVDEAMRAWHAGVGSWCGKDDVNSRSIGIELDNDGTSPFPAAQMDALEVLVTGIMSRWPIPAGNVIGHSDLAPGRKIDPGPRFDWPRLARQNLAAPSNSRASPAPVDEGEFCKRASAVGYAENAAFKALLDAVRLRYRPWSVGPLEASDMALLPDPEA